MTDQPEIERQLGIASLPLFLISPAWGLNLPYIDNIAVLLQILINETFYGVSQYLLPGFQYFPNNLLSLSLIGVRYSNNCSNLSITYLYIFFAVSCLVSAMDGWARGCGMGAVYKLWHKYNSKIPILLPHFLPCIFEKAVIRVLGASPDLREFVWGQMFLSPNKHQQEYQTRPPPASLTARKLVKSEGNNMFFFWLEKFF